jgi:hypothetical protein
MKTIITASVLAAALSLATTARAAVLFERSLVVDRSANVFATSQFDLKLVFGDSFLNPSNPATLFDGVSINPSDAGKIFTSDASDPAFAAATSRLTDGSDQFIRLTLTETASGRSEQRGWQESGFFTGAWSGGNPDLQGAPIEAFQLRIDGFTLVPDGVATPPVDLRMTFSILGTVPEPSTLALGGLAAAAAWAYTGRRARRHR